MTANTAAFHPSDEELGARFAAGDPAAIAELYVRWSPRIRKYVSSQVGERAVAEDITQATFVRAMEARTSLRDPARVRPWLFIIARNLARKQVNWQRRQPGDDIELLGVAVQDAPEDEVISRATTDLMWRAAASLDERQHTVLRLMLRHGFNASEVADALGVTTNHAYQLEHRAKEALASAVGMHLLANSVHECDRLSALLPADVSTLTAGQHRTIAHHVRRCNGCRSKVVRLTAASALFSGIPLLVLPRRLRDPHVLRAASAGAGLRLRGLLRPRRPRPPVAIGAGIALVLLSIVPLTLHLRTPPRRPVTPPRTSAHPSSTRLTPVPHAALTPGAALAASRTAVANASSYQLTSSGLPLGGLDNLELSFDRSGNFAGTATFAHPFTGLQPVARVGGTLYTQGDGSSPQPYVEGILLPDSMMQDFNLTAAEAQRLGTQWFSLSGARQQVAAGAITSAVRGYDTPVTLASTLYPAGITATWFQHNDAQVSLQLSNGDIVTLDQSTLLPVTVTRPDGLVLDLRSWNAPLTITTPAPLMAMP